MLLLYHIFQKSQPPKTKKPQKRLKNMKNKQKTKQKQKDKANFTQKVERIERRRTGSFIVAIVMAVLGALTIYACYQVLPGEMTELEQLSMIFLVPVYLLIFGLTYAIQATSLVCSVRAICSHLKPIRIISIILLLLALAEITCTTLILIDLLKI